MNLIQRYLHAVRGWLPEKHQRDYLRDLEEDLSSQIDERERVKGAALDEHEVVELLRQRGHPLLVATRFLPQQCLIGPTWYPVMRLALRAMIVWILAPVYGLILAPLAALGSSNPVAAFFKVLLQFPGAAVSGAAAVVITIAILERLEIRFKPFDSWNPAELPDGDGTLTTPAASRGESFINMAGTVLLLLWWCDVVQLPGTAALQVELGPEWARWQWPIVGAMAASAALSCARLVDPWWRPAYGLFNLALQTFNLCIITGLLAAGASLTLEITGAQAPNLAKLSWMLNQLTLAILLGIGIGSACKLVAEIRRLIQARRRDA